MSPPAAVDRVRFARPAERAGLEELQRRSSLVSETYRAALLAHPDAIAIDPGSIARRHLRVAEIAGRVVGFSLVVPLRRGVVELDGLFVEPEFMRAGIGRRLLEDATQLARRRGASAMEVTANPAAVSFYVAIGFVRVGQSDTRFGPADRMRLSLAR